MGNCVFRGTCELNRFASSETATRTVKVMTSNGGVMELCPPITAECITSEFPNHAIFTTQHPLLDDHPLLHTDPLHLGVSYFLLPINKSNHPPISTTTLSSKPQHICCATPYRMSLDTTSQQISHHQKRWSSSSDISGLDMMSLTPRSIRNNNGVWKVKLVINPEQLSEILAKETTTEELVESLRTVAKCGNYGNVASAANSDKWSISSATDKFQHSTQSVYGSSL